MFWQSVNVLTVDELLKKENVSLTEILDDQFTLQEIKNANRPLIIFLCQKDIIEELVNNALQPVVSETVPENDRYRIAHQSCEVLTMNCPDIPAAVITCENALRIIVQFLERNRTPLPLLASFYTRILTQLISKHGQEMTDLLRNSSFLNDSLSNISTSAIMDLIYRVIIVQGEPENINAVKQWFVEEKFAERLCSVFVESRDADAHSNAAYLWGELVRILRDLQYSACEKRVDILLDSLQDERAVEGLMRAMVTDSPPYSVVEAVCSILLTLLQTNFIPNCPEHLEAVAEKGHQGGWMGGVSDGTVGGCLVLTSNEPLWQPDPEHVVEMGIVSVIKPFEDLLQRCERHCTDEGGSSAMLMAIKSNEGKSSAMLMAIKSNEGGSSAMLMAIKLLAALLNTNHMATHVGIGENAPDLLIGRLDFAFGRPSNGLLQSAICSCVRHVLFTKTEPFSPLISSMVIWLVNRLNSVDNRSGSLSRIEGIQQRGFFMALAHWLETARLRGPNARLIDRILEEQNLAEIWSNFVEMNLRAFEKANEADNVDLPTGSCATLLTETADVMPDAQAIQAFTEYDTETIVVTLPEHFGLPIDAFTSTSYEKDFDIPSSTLIDFDIQKVIDDTPRGEAAFEALCSLRIDGMEEEGEDRRASLVRDRAGTIEEVWPTPSVSKDPVTTTFPVAWTAEETTADDWPANPTGSNDAWADFASSKATSVWTGDTVDPLPVCAGIASALFASSPVSPRSTGMKMD